MTLRGIRGAVQVESDTVEAIERATKELLEAMLARNGVDPAALTAIWFTQTADLTAGHAPAAARALGWRYVPLMGGLEASVAKSPPRIVRALILAALDAGPREVRHVYLGAARALRPDLDRGEPA